MRDCFRICIADEFAAALRQPLAQLPEILDDPVMHHCDKIGCVRMSVVFGGPPVCRPARVANADVTTERFTLEACLKRAKLAFGTPTAEHTMVECGDARGIVAAVFEALERIDQLARDRLAPQNSDDPAHPSGWPLC